MTNDTEWTNIGDINQAPVLLANVHTVLNNLNVEKWNKQFRGEFLCYVEQF